MNDIHTYNSALPHDDARICDALAAAIDKAILITPGASSKIWHRHPVWFIDGNPIVGYHVLKGSKKQAGCVRLFFWSGQSFDEPGLNPEPPDTKFKSAGARFTSADDIPARDLARWLRKSIEIQWDYKNIVKRKGKLVRLDPAPRVRRPR